MDDAQKFNPVTNLRSERARARVRRRQVTLTERRDRLRAALMRAVTEDDIIAIAQKLVLEARCGDVQAAREVLDRTLGRPDQTIDVAVTRVEFAAPPLPSLSPRTELPDISNGIADVAGQIAAQGAAPGAPEALPAPEPAAPRLIEIASAGDVARPAAAG